MPDRSTSEDAITRNTWILYYISKKKKVTNNVSELSRELGYKDDSTVNKKIRRLADAGYVEESGNAFRLTQKGKRKILFLILPKWALFFLSVIGFVTIYNGIVESIFNYHVDAWIHILQGFVTFVPVAALYWAYRTGERQLFQVGRQLEEG